MFTTKLPDANTEEGTISITVPVIGCAILISPDDWLIPFGEIVQFWNCAVFCIIVSVVLIDVGTYSSLKGVPL